MNAFTAGQTKRNLFFFNFKTNGHEKESQHNTNKQMKDPLIDKTNTTLTAAASPMKINYKANKKVP